MSSVQNEWVFEWDCDKQTKTLGHGLDIDCSASFQLKMNSQALAETELPSNDKHVIAINFILMAVSDNKKEKVTFLNSNSALLSRTSAGG